jgi:HAD superfamily hydrolase (TIGR01509 family)
MEETFMVCELVIFDCDGVLLDSEMISCAADADAYCSIGYQVTAEEMAFRFAGVPGDAIDTILSAEIDKVLPLDFRSTIRSKILLKYRSELNAMEGVEETLNKLKIKKCVASSSAPSKLALGLVETGIFELLYPHIYSAQLVEKGKPHPDIFLYAAKQMGVSPDKCLVIEDSVAGVTAARAAGMRSIGFIGGSHCSGDQSERLTDAGASVIVSEFKSILNHIF